MKLSRIAVFASLLAASPAFAAADLVASITQPAGLHVYEAGTFTATVANVGSKNASVVTLSVQLPVTHTSPQVYVMGNLSGWAPVAPTCTQSGTRLNCSFGTVNKGTSRSLTFTIALPESTAALSFTNTVATQSAENTLLNNVATLNATLLTYPVPVNPQRAAINQHCTGTGLTAYFECTKFPGSTTSHNTVFEVGGTVSFPGNPGYTGTWSQPTANALVFQYNDINGPVANFSGHGVDGNCYEGLTTFPGSSYVSPYRVCLQ